MDEVVEFKALTREHAEIVELQLERLRARLAGRGIELELTDAAKETLAEAGPTYGARPLKRALQRLVENPLAMRLLEGGLRRRRPHPRRRPERRARLREGFRARNRRRIALRDSRG